MRIPRDRERGFHGVVKHRFHANVNSVPRDRLLRAVRGYGIGATASAPRSAGPSVYSAVPRNRESIDKSPYQATPGASPADGRNHADAITSRTVRLPCAALRTRDTAKSIRTPTATEKATIGFLLSAHRGTSTVHSRRCFGLSRTSAVDDPPCAALHWGRRTNTPCRARHSTPPSFPVATGCIHQS